MHQFSESQTKVPWSAIILKIVSFIRFCMVNGQRLPVQLICNNRNFQIDGASRYLVYDSNWLVHLLILVCSFRWCVLFLCLAYPWSERSIISFVSTTGAHSRLFQQITLEIDEERKRNEFLALIRNCTLYLLRCTYSFSTVLAALRKVFLGNMYLIVCVLYLR